MKKMILFPVLLFFLAGINSSLPAQTKTIANLRTAFRGESTASAKYAAYAAQARKEGFPQVAVMFEATSKAEAIHAANHKSILEKMGQAVESFTPEFTVKTTAENLADAIGGETHEFTEMYPGFIETAKSENAPDAVKSFRWAQDTEKRHGTIYQVATEALKNKKTGTLSSIYYVCPKCGNTFNTSRPEKNCSFCYTASSKFIKFGN